MSQQRPDHARHLGGERDDDSVGMSSREKTAQPVTEPGIPAAQCRQRRARTLYQHLAQVLTAAFGDPEQARFTACRRLPRNKPEPCGQIAASCEGPSITDGSDESSCIESADAGNAYQPARGLILFRLQTRCRTPQSDYRRPAIVPSCP